LAPSGDDALVAAVPTGDGAPVAARADAAPVAAPDEDEALAIPAAFDFSSLAGLSTEVRQKLERHRPATLAQAARIDGITPAALLLLLAHLKSPPSRKSA
jgi:tRNA uridine 5-carboxymethylaminomethyl modification enzyme